MKDQVNMKVHFAAAVFVIAAGFFFSISITHWCIVAICIFAVLSLEMINTALENLVNLVTVERNPLAGRIKDIAAGAVLVASTGSAVVGLLIFSQYI